MFAKKSIEELREEYEKTQQWMSKKIFAITMSNGHRYFTKSPWYRVDSAFEFMQQVRIYERQQHGAVGITIDDDIVIHPRHVVSVKVVVDE